MTDQSKQVAQLLAQRDRFVSLTFVTADIALECDERGVISFAAGSVQAMLGRSPDSLNGSDLENLAVIEDRPLMREFLERLSGARRVSDQRVLLQGVRGRAIPTLVSGMRDARKAGVDYVAIRRAPSLSMGRPAQAGLGQPLVGAEFGVWAGGLARQAVMAGSTANLALYQMDLSEVDQIHGPETRHTLESELVRSMRAWSMGSEAVGSAGPGRYGVLLDEQTDPAALENRLQQVALEQGLSLRVEHRALRIDEVLDTDSLPVLLDQAMGRFEHRGLRGMSGVNLADLAPARRLGGRGVLRDSG